MTRRQATENIAQERVDAAVVDAYERRVAGQDATAEDAALEAEIAAAELSAYVSLHQRVASLPRQDVAASVRAVVLSAAARGAEEHAAHRPQESLLARALAWIMRPGPLMTAVALAAVLVAVSVRQESAPMAGAKPDSAVAMAEPSPVQAAPEPMAPAPARIAPEAPAPAAAPVVAAAAVAEVAPPAAAVPAAAPMARPLRTFEAQAASLGPAAAADEPAKAAPNRATDELAKRAAVTENARHQIAAAKAELAQNDAPMRQLENQADREVAVAKPSAQNREAAPVDALNQRAAGGAQAVSGNYAPASPQAPAEQNEAPADASEQKNLATRNQVAEKASADAVSRWRQSVDDAQTPEERVAALKQLLVAAQAAGDAKTVKLVQQALKVAEAQNVARKRAENVQATPPALRAKAAPSQGSADLKAQKSKN